MKALSLVLIFFVTSCVNGEEKRANLHSGYIAKECSIKSNGGQKTLVAENSSGLNGLRDLCLQQGKNILNLSSKIRIRAYKNGSSDIDFICDKKKAIDFFKKNSGEKVYFVFNNRIVGSARVEKSQSDGRCVLPQVGSLEESVSICENLSDNLGFGKNECYETCKLDDLQKNACVLTK